MENKYPKLVRDKIPEIVKENSGVEPTYRILENDGEYLNALFKKLNEEIAELQQSIENNNTEEELADIFEVLDATVAAIGKTTDDIKNIQKEKREKRGGFEKRILMDEPPKPQS